MNDKANKVMTVDGDEVVAVPATSPMQIIDAAVARGTDIDVLEKMFQLYERDQDRLSEKEFDAAMAKFQSTCPAIRRSKKADRYVYAPFEQVMKVIRSHLSENNLSVRFNTKYESDGYITTYCTVAHAAGHKETSEFMCPIDKENKTRINSAQLQGSANSYGKRYALSNALNLAYTDEDDDGRAAGTVMITDEDVANLDALITEVGADKPMFLKWVQAETLEDIASSKLTTCISRLEGKRK